MKVLVSSLTDKGRLIEIVTRVGNLTEATAYQSLLDMDKVTCPHCGERLKPAPEDMMLAVYNPLTSLFNMELGTPVVKCQACGQEVRLESNLDLSAFPTTLHYLKSLREEYNRRLKAKRGGK